jgi:ribosome modulation factor
MVPVFGGCVTEDGDQLRLDEAERSLRRGYLKKLSGKRVDVIVRIHRNQRSQKQNKWHWAVAVPLIAQELGYDKHEHEDVHYALVSKCFGTHFDERVKQDVPNKRSSDLTTTEFSDLMEWEVRWAAQELGIVIPLPSEGELS